MKKQLLFAISALLVCACSLKDESDFEIEEIPTEQTLVCSISELSKVTFKENNDTSIKLSWELGDTITLYNKSTSARIGDFVARDIKNNNTVTFNSLPSNTPLEAGTSYWAYYPKSNEQTIAQRFSEVHTLTQEGNNGINHLDKGCKMKTQFKYNQNGSTIRFFHEESLMSVKFTLPDNKVAEKLIVTDGNQKYTLNFKNINSSEQVTARLLIKNNNYLRNLIFEIVTGNNVYTYNHLTEVEYKGSNHYSANLPSYGEGLELNSTKFTSLSEVEKGVITIKDVDFTSTNFNGVEVRSAALNLNDDKIIEIYENNENGELLGRISLPGTNSLDNFATTTTKLLKKPSGIVDLYLKFNYSNKNVYKVDYIDFVNYSFDGQKSLVDFFLPMEPITPLTSNGIWGAGSTVPRDTSNGIEDATHGKWCYWDGGVVKSDDGKYHMYCSRWNQNYSHSNGWKIGSMGIHAVANNIMGPYKDKGLIYADVDESFTDVKGGRGHNVYGFRLHDGRYGVVTSEITQGKIFASSSPDGPFELLGDIKVDLNGFDKGLAFYNNAPNYMSNVQIRQLPGKGYILIGRSTAPMISEDNVLGPYKIMGRQIFANLSFVPQIYNEDPTIWYSGGLFHIVYNNWASDTSHHFTSKDGYSNWKYRGVAFDKKNCEIFKYTNGTINSWEVVQRPTAYVNEEGHVTHFLFSVIDVLKGSDLPNDNHASKIVIVPFDGKGFDDYMASLDK